jgi:hypothetical protein
MAVVNALAYYDVATMTAVKNFIVQALGGPSHLKNSSESPLANISHVDDVISGKLQHLQFRVELSSSLMIGHVLRQLVQVDGSILSIKSRFNFKLGRFAPKQATHGVYKRPHLV